MTLFERLFSFMIKPQVILGYLVMVVLSYYFVDKNLALLLFSYHINEHYAFLNGLTLLGDSKVFLVGFLIVALATRYISHNRIWEERAWFLWLCVLVPNLICLILKMMLGRARPDLLFQDNLYGFYGFHHDALYWSMPSGHTTTVMGVAFGLSILFPRYSWAYFIGALTIVATRVLLLQHYLSDVLIATFLAFIEVGILWFVLRRQECLQQVLIKTQVVDLK
jgi:membrane-associated phospholipid phosphatase